MSIKSVFSRIKRGAHARSGAKYNLTVSAENVKSIFLDCGDFELRPLYPGGKRENGISICYIDGVVSGSEVAEDVIRPFTDSRRLADASGAEEYMQLLLCGLVYSYTAKRRETMDELVNDIINGFCAVIFDSSGAAVTFETKTSQVRSIGEPSVEKTVKGAKDAFVETIRTNTSLVRRKLRNPELKVEQTIIGRKSSTNAAIMYVKGIANDDILTELKRRLDAIDVDGLTATGNLEQYIVDEPRSPFPQLITTERPDKFAHDLLQGRIGVIADGIPIGFILPVTLTRFMKVSDDRSQHFVVATGLSLLRWLSLFLTILLPASYVAIAMYHQELIPAKLLMSIISAKQEVPFSVGLEVIGILFAFELLQEAGLRLPDPVGDTVSIIGALIVGQSAVDAKIVSPIAVIVVATAGICGFMQPSSDMGAALRVVRFFLVILAVLLGVFGVMLGLAILVWHLSSIESFGVSYTSPLSDGGAFNILRSIIRPPLWSTKYREPYLKTEDKRYQK